MMQKIQKFGGAMFTPVLLFAFAGTVVGLGTLFTTEVIFGSLAAKDSLWYQCWNVILQGGWTVFNQLPLLFAVSLPHRPGVKTERPLLYGSAGEIPYLSVLRQHDAHTVGRCFWCRHVA